MREETYKISELLPNFDISEKTQNELEVLFLGQTLYGGTAICQVPIAKVKSVSKEEGTITVRYLGEEE